MLVPASVSAVMLGRLVAAVLHARARSCTGRRAGGRERTARILGKDQLEKPVEACELAARRLAVTGVGRPGAGVVDDYLLQGSP